ncbi:MAG: hypothetical protein WD708_02770, partial [Kiritimatiellia bacterium]
MKTRLHSLGNEELLKNPRIGFLCSRSPGPEAVLSAYAWAREQCDAEATVVSGFHSPVERDVFEILSRRRAKMIQVYARRLPRRLEPWIIQLLERDRLLILTPHDDNVVRENRSLCLQRNELVRRLCENNVFEPSSV